MSVCCTLLVPKELALAAGDTARNQADQDAVLLNPSGVKETDKSTVSYMENGLNCYVLE